MNEYQIGKDIQSILDRLESLEAAARKSGSKEPCKCGTDVDEALLSEHGVREIERDGVSVATRYKTFTFTKTGRLGYCNWKEYESVTILENGEYEDVTFIRCEHGYALGCKFTVNMKYKGTDDHVFTTSSWNGGLGGTEEKRIDIRGFRRAIRDSFDGITKMTRKRECED